MPASPPRRLLEWYADQPLLRAVLPGVLLVALGLLVFGAMLEAVQERDDFSLFDRPVLELLVAMRSDVATAVLAALTFVTGPTVLPIIVLVACVAWGLLRREWWRPLLLAGAMVGSTLLSLLVKGIVARPRPPEETMYIPGSETTGSFPSGHTIGTATFLLVAGYLVASRHRTRRVVVGWLVGGVVGAAAVALSRLYLGYHFLTDVVAAAGLAVVVLGVVTIVDRIHVVHGLPPSEPEPGWSPQPPPELKHPSPGP
ncbi:phosphatase PAP2 family protein [Cellulomonas sp. S1-8]|uniref:phosphatase PAP2 family protein n=1 Tax=Cellulomonas sp. S1-8 TaxID=2904790 RepID=UPI0022430980|nr:phosphatase PAP2 family protein [Cellulomonas sp. S1-8]UZN03734.1 phosphatase PAP2 family protein [Cellulomonas sp. S1-8]